MNMKYFTSTLWEKINDLNKDVREHAAKEWKDLSQKYVVQFNEVCKKLPSEFLEVYKDYSCFHDFKIDGVAYQEAPEPSVAVSLKRGSELISLIFGDVQQFFINIIDTTHCIQGQLSWGYCEFDIDKDDNISINVLCDIKNEIKIVFKKISIVQGPC